MFTINLTDIHIDYLLDDETPTNLLYIAFLEQAKIYFSFSGTEQQLTIYKDITDK